MDARLPGSTTDRKEEMGRSLEACATRLCVHFVQIVPSYP